MKLPRSALAAGLLAALAPAGAHAQDPDEQRVAALFRPAVVSAHGGVIAWSDWSPQDERYHLMIRDGGRTVRPDVAPRAVPFDLDAGPGPGPDGGVTIAYSRCATEPSQPEPLERLPDWSSGRGCDIHRYDVATGREAELAGASTGQASEYLPSIWRDEVAFARVYEQRAGRRGRLPYLYVRPLDGSSASDRQPGGARGDERYENGPAGIDLYGRRLSFVWDRFAPPGSPGGVPNGEDFFDAELRLDTVGGSHARLDVASGDSVNKDIFFSGPVGGRGRITYAQDCDGDCPSAFTRRLFTHRISTDATTEQPLPESSSPFGQGSVRDAYVSLTRDGATLYALRGPTDVDPRRQSEREWEIVEVP